MKKVIGGALFTIFTWSCCLAQDIITKKTGEDILAEILEVGSKEVKYLKYESEESPVYTILKTELVMIRYANGAKDIFNIEKGGSDEGMFLQGQQDALAYYHGRNSGAAWAGVTTVLFSPIIGIIPAAICSSVEPTDRNLLYRDPELMNNREYLCRIHTTSQENKKE